MNTVIEEKTCGQGNAKCEYIAPEVEVEWVSSSQSFMWSSEDSLKSYSTVSADDWYNTTTTTP